MSEYVIFMFSKIIFILPFLSYIALYNVKNVIVSTLCILYIKMYGNQSMHKNI